jgi:MOSC domain-containing protein
LNQNTRQSVIGIERQRHGSGNSIQLRFETRTRHVNPPVRQYPSFVEGLLSISITRSMMASTRLLTTAELEAGLDDIRRSPKDVGVVELVVRRPRPGEREVLQEAAIDLTVGLVGDNWSTRSNRHRQDGTPDPDAQVTIMNSRAIALVAQHKDRWQLAGDQLFIDLDLSENNLPAGTQVKVGSAVVEVTKQPHNGCQQFAARFGTDAVKVVNSPIGKQLRLRGINAKVVRPGTVRVGDVAKKL